MPKLGESVHEGTIEQWLVSVGDHVDEYEPLCEVITDKVTAEVPSTISGTITELVVEEGQTVNINTVICKIDSANDFKEEQNQHSQSNVKVSQFENNPNTHEIEEHTASSRANNNGRFSPVVFKLASEHGIDLTQVIGTGFEGRVTKKDIQNIINNPNNQEKEKEFKQTDKKIIQSTMVTFYINPHLKMKTHHYQMNVSYQLKVLEKLSHKIWLLVSAKYLTVG